jgi:hypothetical protein
MIQRKRTFDISSTELTLKLEIARGALIGAIDKEEKNFRRAIRFLHR